MHYHIDQSGKLENTKTITVIADSQGNVAFISKQAKIQLANLARTQAKTKVYVYINFGILCAIIIAQTFATDNHYMIDIEYPGKNAIIKNQIIKSLKLLGCRITPHQITFGLVGKKRNSHKAAYSAYKTIDTKNIKAISLAVLASLK